jgi:hypothetical protein
MPLHKGSGRAVVSGKAIDFAMTSDEGKTVRCMVTQGAIYDLARLSSPAYINLASVNSLSVYLDWQLVIETIASNKYDADDLIHGMVVIAPRDLIRAGFIL